MSNPFQAQEIAANTFHRMMAIRGCQSILELKRVWHEWSLYADSAGVCRQIREHMADEYANVSRGFAPAKPRSIRNPSDGSTGHAHE